MCGCGKSLGSLGDNYTESSPDGAAQMAAAIAAAQAQPTPPNWPILVGASLGIAAAAYGLAWYIGGKYPMEPKASYSSYDEFE